jgi:hypothetical protein
MTFVLNSRPQSTAAGRLQPATRTLIVAVLAGVSACLGALPAVAQQQVTVRADGTQFAADPGGTVLGRLAAGATLTVQSRQGADVQVLLDGWIFGASVQVDTRDGHDVSVTPPQENVRVKPNGRVLARLVRGALLDSVERKGRWVHVRRSGWIAASAFASAGPATAPARAAARGARAEPPVDTSQTEEVDPRRAVLRRRVQLFLAPDTPSTGFLDAGVPVRITARAGEWVRIEASGWVRESEVRPPGGQAVSGVTAAELRTHPDEWQGKILRWNIQFIALQTADELRAPDFTPGQHYILARGPAPEYAFVYVTVPDDKLAKIAQLRPLDTLTVVARVRSGRSSFLANPILDLVDVVP